MAEKGYPYDDNLAFIYTTYPDAKHATSEKIFKCQSIGPCIPSGKLQIGQILCKAEYISIMPLSRAHLDLGNNDNGAEELGLTRTRLGDIAAGESILKIVESNSDKYQVGEYVHVGENVTEYKLLWDDGRDSKYKISPSKVPSFIAPEKYLSCMTVPAGITSFIAVHHNECGKYPLELLKTRDKSPIVLISSAAGAVGVIIGQLYKRAGAIVIGATSTTEKAGKLTNDYGFNFAIAYKEEKEGLEGGLKRIGNELNRGRFLIDLFVDNVGADQLDCALKFMAMRGRILGIGAIAELDGYADETKFKGIFQYTLIIARELTFAGFLVTAHIDKIPSAAQCLGAMLAKGEIKSAETVVEGKFQDWSKLCDRMIRGEKTFGRVILKIV